MGESKIALVSKEYQVYESTHAYAKVAEALKQASKEQKVGEKTYVKLEETKVELDNIKARTLEAKETKYAPKSCTALEADLKPFGLDTSLVESLKLVLTKDPAERSEFDAAIMSKLDAALTATSVSLEGKLAEEAPAEKALDDATTAAQCAN